MGYVITLVVAVVVVAVAAGVFLGVRRRRGDVQAVATPAATAATARSPRPEPGPMHGLEDALAQVTDRSGRSMAERLDDESEVVEGLRVTDDTGPLLRRALDHVRPDETDAGASGAAPSDAASSED